MPRNGVKYLIVGALLEREILQEWEYTRATWRKPGDHSLQPVDNNLISSIARASDSHRVLLEFLDKTSARQTGLWGG